MAATLRKLVQRLPRRRPADCPILDDLAAEPTAGGRVERLELLSCGGMRWSGPPIALVANPAHAPMDDLDDRPSPDLAERCSARIADALERLAPPPRPRPDFAAADAFVWRADRGALEPVSKVNRVDIALLRGVDRVRDLLLDNTERFASGLPANNALLWGARGMGKSSLVKAAHAEINRARRRRRRG